eukprot:TRINITY_DN2675_c0_g2::TRINITY_DN2675_c0_g2_i2::g.25949::m.25949 TRINITY_DN2675_c0_g2::TRINITY_DN2675_c0_g2_i2::g.25949  ORF type:complete len:245 (-),score=10.26,Ion_trans/PF00520.26/1.1e+02,Ion_trans/PF00520.26/3.1e-06,NnrU/PF07298.6/0.19,NnrU/PF07298.6/14,DUF4282/PF14110.1/0.018,DUF4282/PF14110.1/1.1e+04,YfhO/PF09586.5/0.7,YfhO/PF09586.5/21,PKD_channel/PF08016.7/56,PKD_channel/PF08016.7/0.84,Nodulin_late/PF07127.6/3.1,Nodulin_late/PF07127.6/81 TRINITY_DN2675_c0_g2_i2:872-1606(-)
MRFPHLPLRLDGYDNTHDHPDLGKGFRPPTLLDRLSSLAHRLQGQQFYKIIYAFMIFISLILIFWTFMENSSGYSSEGEGQFFYALELFITVLLVLEILVRITAEREAYWKDRGNVIDFVIMSLCVLSLMVLLDSNPAVSLSSLDGSAGPVHGRVSGSIDVGRFAGEARMGTIGSGASRLKQAATTVVIVLRYMTQFFRLGLVVKRHSRAKTLETDMIDVINIDMPLSPTTAPADFLRSSQEYV